MLRRRTGALASTRGLTFHQYNVLRILRGARPAAITRARVEERTLETVPRMGDLLAELAGEGLVRMERGPDGVDVHSITVAGTELLAALDEPVAAADREAMAGLDPAEAQTLLTLLRRIRAD